MTRRLEEVEAEIAFLKEMQAKLEKEMGVAPDPAKEESAVHVPLPGSKEEADSRSVYVGNVDYACTPEEVQQHFESCGTVNRVTIKTNIAGQPKGFAYVEFLEREAVQGALDTLNESELHGRLLKVCAKRTNIPGMKKRSLHRLGFNSYMGSSYPVMRAAPHKPPYFTSPYGYGKAPPRFRRAVCRRFSPYF